MQEKSKNRDRGVKSLERYNMVQRRKDTVPDFKETSVV